MAAMEFLKAVRRRWPLVLACFLLATIVGYIFSPEEPAEPVGAGYEASLTLIPSPEVTTGVNLHLAAHLSTGADVALLAAEKLPAGVQPAGVGLVSASVSPEAGSLTINVTDKDRNRAGLLADAYAEATIEFLQSSTTQSQDDALAAAEAELDAIEANIAKLQEQRSDDSSDDVLQAKINTELTRYGIVFQRVQDLLSADEPAPSLQILGTAQVTPIDPGGISAPTDRRARALLAGAVGLLLGLGLALTVDRLDTRLRERDEVEDAFGLPVLAEVPKISRRARADHALVTELRPDSEMAEAYRSLRSAITLVSQSARLLDGAAGESGHQGTPQVLVVTGAEGSQGKSTTVVNLAAAVAETGRSVLVIDCDFRKPEAHLFLDARPGSDLADLVTSDFSGYLDQIVRSTSVRGVDLVTSIEPVRNSTAVVSRMPGIIADARGRADVVLIDSSPLLVTSDAVDVLRYADAALVACRVGRTTYNQATRARRLLQRANVTLLGVVLTGTPPHRGTPYGQPSRTRALWSKITKWVVPPNPDREEPTPTGPDAEETAELPVPATGEPVSWEGRYTGRDQLDEQRSAAPVGRRKRSTPSSQR